MIGASASRVDRNVLSIAFAIAVIAYVVTIAASMGRLSYDAWVTAVLVPALGGGSVALLRRLAPHAGNVSLVPLLTAALVVKGLGTVIRYAVTFGWYGGHADAANYHDAAVVLAGEYRHGHFGTRVSGGSTATVFIKVITGLVYAVIGPSMVGGFVVFALAAFWGLYLLLRAFQIAVPAGNARRYAALIFFTPSMVFWPSSIGKESWMILMLGLASYGAARVFTHQRWGHVALVLGGVGIIVVRPHIAVLVVAGLTAGFIVRPARAGWRSRVGLVVGIAALVLGGIVAAGQIQHALRLDSARSVTDALDVAQARTDEGGSSFSPARIHSVADVPWATVTVLFRPLPSEAHNAPAIAAAIEGGVLIALFVLSWRSIGRGFRLSLRNAYLAFASIYSIVFVFAFSSFGNFGIITRQRVQLLPFVFALLCLGGSAPQTEPAIETRGDILVGVR